MRHRTLSFELRQLEDGQIAVDIQTRVAPPSFREQWFDVTYQYRFEEPGDARVYMRVVPHGAWPEQLPRIGVAASLPTEFSQVEWFGRGPGESYSDSCAATSVGRFQSTVDGLMTPYLRPQENGNRSDCDYVALRSRDDVGVLIAMEKPSNFSASRYTAEDLANAMHPHELVARPFIHLTIDAAQNGLGNSSCGPEVFADYRLAPKTHDLAFRIVPIHSDADMFTIARARF